MKAISVRQPFASMIASGRKTIETRTYNTLYRGPLLIVSSKRPAFNLLPLGKALCTVEVINCRPMVKADEKAAYCELYPGAFAWLLGNIQKIELFDVKGRLGIYEIPDELILQQLQS